jgi:phenylpyruvate tautomerase PptA (4-oxalocrotonate tautomerase family)
MFVTLDYTRARSWDAKKKLILMVATVVARNANEAMVVICVISAE